MSPTPSPRLPRAVGGLALAAALTGLSSCSLVLDLPADCAPEDCNGYQCNADKTGCLFDCVNDNECDEGFLCREDKASCLAIGCAPDGELVELFPEAQGRVTDIAMVWNGAELGAVYPSGGGLVFQRFDLTGTSLAEAVTLDEGAAQPGAPSMVWTGDVWALTWEATGLVDDERRELLRFAVVGVGDRFDVEPRTLWNTTENRQAGTIEKSVDFPDIAFDKDLNRYVIVWSTTVDVADVNMLLVDREGRDLEGNREIPHGASRQVTLTGTDSVAPQVVVRSAGVYDVVYREGSAPANVILRTVDELGMRQGSDLNTSSTDVRADSHGHAGITTGSVVAFTETNGDVGVTFRAQIKRDRALAGGTKLAVDREFDSTADATVASDGDGQYAVVFVADKNLRSEIYMARFKDNGAAIAVPFTLTDLLTRAPVDPVVAPTSSGYMVIFKETDGDNAGKILGRHWSCDPVEE